MEVAKVSVFIHLSDNNAKLKKTQRAHEGMVKVQSFDLPAGHTCPCADKCRFFCFATEGAFDWNGKKALSKANYESSLTDGFVQSMVDKLNDLCQHTRAGRKVCIRIHASGDFYSREYAQKWSDIARQCPDVTFYAYSKSVSIVKSVNWTDNVFFAFSRGGTQDLLIEEGDTEAQVFNSEEDAIAHGYTVAVNGDDLEVCQRGKKLGLVFHGRKGRKYAKEHPSS